MIAPWRFFAVEVARCVRLSPSFMRITFSGDDLNTFADNGFDQRIKLIIPLDGHGVAPMPTGTDWHAQWSALPSELRNPVRTYTVRAVRQEMSEVDIDLVVHHGIAGHWAEQTQPGEKLYILGPDARFDGSHGGVDFRSTAKTLLLVGDETAVPAIASIVERLPADTTGEIVLEVPHEADFLPLNAPAGMRITWLAREDTPHGSALIPAVIARFPRQNGEEVEEVELLWEVPEETAFWLAGEAGVIKTLRRHLVTERGVDRRSVAFMGYWRQGRSEDN